jgi:hypothetical protein
MAAEAMRERRTEEDIPGLRQAGLNAGVNSKGAEPIVLMHAEPARRCCQLYCDSWLSNLQTIAVQPVWCEAPTPLPLSPWKYSLN